VLYRSIRCYIWEDLALIGWEVREYVYILLVVIFFETYVWMYVCECMYESQNVCKIILLKEYIILKIISYYLIIKFKK